MYEEARRFALASIQEELHQTTVPTHVHGTLNGYNNHHCRGPLCRAAVIEARGTAKPPTWGPDRAVWEVTREMLHEVADNHARTWRGKGQQE